MSDLVISEQIISQKKVIFREKCVGFVSHGTVSRTHFDPIKPNFIVMVPFIVCFISRIVMSLGLNLYISPKKPHSGSSKYFLKYDSSM